MVCKKILFIFIFLFLTNSLLSASEEDLQVEKVFHKMIKEYKNENIQKFFKHISEKNFQQDYLFFYDAIDKDFVENDFLSVNTWIDKITKDKTKAFLYLNWEKRYININSNKELRKEGSSRLLFENIKGKYKLIGIDGDILWGSDKF